METIFVESRSYNPSSYAQRLRSRQQYPRTRKSTASAPQPTTSHEATVSTLTSEPIAQILTQQLAQRPSSQTQTQIPVPSDALDTPWDPQSQERTVMPTTRSGQVIRLEPPKANSARARDPGVRAPAARVPHSSSQHETGYLTRHLSPHAARRPTRRPTPEPTPGPRQEQSPIPPSPCEAAHIDTPRLSTPDQPTPHRENSGKSSKRASGDQSGANKGRKRHEASLGQSKHVTKRRNGKQRATSLATYLATNSVSVGGKKCGFCAKAMSFQHRCCSCDFSLCSHCLINASIVHPGHSFEDYAAEVQASSALCDVCNLELGSERFECRLCPDTYLCPPCRFVHPPHHTLSKVVLGQSSVQGKFVCDTCQQELPGVRWECQNCPETNLCTLCRYTHPSQHTLVRKPEHTYENGRVIEEIGDSNEGNGSEGNGGEGDSNGLHVSDVEEASLVPHGAAAALENCPNPTDPDLIPRAPQKGQEQNTRPRVTITLSVEGNVGAEEIAKGLLQTARQLLSHKRRQGTVNGTWTHASSGRVLDWQDGLGREGTGVLDDGHDDDGDASDGRSVNSLNDFELPDISSIAESGLSVEQPCLTGRRRWLPEDRKQLWKLKEKGWSNNRVAAALGRTSSAVTQEWRKERQHQAVRAMSSQ